MRKTDKKIDNKLREVLTEVCEWALDEIEGYHWISHSVNYDAISNSLVITCAFKSQQSLDALKHSRQDIQLQKLIVKNLASISIVLKSVNKQIKWIVE